jgi:trimeric autotransporter adhesin
MKPTLFGFLLACALFTSCGRTPIISILGESTGGGMATGAGGGESTSTGGGASCQAGFARIDSECPVYLKASNTNEGDTFGTSVSLSGDGNTLAIGAWDESSSATGVNGNQSDN